MRRNPDNKAFILLMVLVLLAVAAVVLAALARQSCELATEASSARRSLQLEWGSVSAKELLLGSAAEMLDQPETEGQKAPRAIRRTVSLKGIKYELVLSDEQVKANVNLLSKRREGQGVEGILQSLQSGARTNLRVQLRPSKIQNQETAVGLVPLYGSYDQLFQYGHPSELVNPASTDGTPVSHITCWGSGQVNFLKAPKEVLRATFEGLLDETQLDDLEKLVQDNPYASLSEAVKVLKLPAEKAPQVTSLLTDQSSCFSLWVVADDSTRKFYRLYIHQSADALSDRQSLLYGW
jgi:hypothetical protein